MESFYLLEYIKNHSSIDPIIIDELKYDLDIRLYFYGKHFRNPHEDKTRSFLSVIFNFLISSATFLRIIQKICFNKRKNCIISSAYFSINNELKKNGYEVYSPSWILKSDFNIFPNLELYFASRKLKKILSNASFYDLLSDVVISKVKDFEEKLIRIFQKGEIKAVILSNDMTFFDKVLINVCKKAGIPSFIFLHGLPGRYNIVDDNRTDYLIVWGEKIKENYIKIGFSPNKIIVSGHPYYKSLNNKSLKFSLENILVLTKSISGGQHSDKVRLADRGNLVLYLLSVEKVLREFGIRSVRLRPHPSENINWYYCFIDKEFFVYDKFDLKKSIEYSSLVIGPTSTVFLESLYYGKNYIVYEPAIEGMDLLKFELVPPFDKSDERVPIATNESELKHIIEKNIRVDKGILSEYIKTPFDLSFVKTLINK